MGEKIEIPQPVVLFSGRCIWPNRRREQSLGKNALFICPKAAPKAQQGEFVRIFDELTGIWAAARERRGGLDIEE